MRDQLQKLLPPPPSLATLIAAVMFVAAMPPWDLAPLAYVALVPWLLQLHRSKTLKDALTQGFWMCFLFTVLAAFWVAPTLNHFAQVPWPLAILGLFLMGLFHELQFQIFAFVAYFARVRLRILPTRIGGILFFTATYTALDFLTPKIFANLLGHTQHTSSFVRSWASVGGVPMIGFFVALMNMALYACAAELQAHSLRYLFQKRPALFALPLGIIAFTLGGGFYLHERLALSSHPSRMIRAAVIQANIGDFDKVAAITGKYSAGEKIIQTYLDGSTEAMKAPERPDVIVWPETAYPSTFRKPMVSAELERDQMLERWVKENRVPLWFGGYDRSETQDYNSLFFLDPLAPEGAELQTYHKTILLPFGEYIPFADRLDWIRDRFPQVGFFGKGPGPSTYLVRASSGISVRVQPLICYEAVFPEFTRAGARAGADLLLNITNDSWFGTFGEPQMHFAFAKFRSIETGLPQLRATNTGISALILPDGSVQNASEVASSQVLHYSIALEKRATLYLRIGNALVWLCFFGALAVALGRAIRLRRTQWSARKG